MNELLQTATQLHQRGQLAAAAEQYVELRHRHPENPQLMFLLGTLHYQMGEFEESVCLLAQAIEKVPTDASWQTNLGAALVATRDYEGAQRAFETALKLNPTYANAATNLGVVLKSLGQIEEALTVQRDAVRLDPSSKITHSNYLFTLTAHELLSPADTLLEYQQWDRRHGREEVFTCVDRWESKSTLRIGYVSCDLYAHPVTRFLMPLLRNHDPDRVDVFVYADVQKADATTEQVKGLVPNWRDISRLSDPEAAALIQQDNIDILIDLGGHTAFNRLGVFAYRPAPVQATYLGYFGPTGMKAVDYWITDHELHPPDTEDASTEDIYRLSRCWVAYESPSMAPPPNRRFLGSPLTFASFNDVTKLSRQVLRTWATILLECPGSRLRLQAKQFADEGVRRRVTNTLEHLGVDKTRLQLVEHYGLSAYYKSYHGVDIVLDPFPRTGGTTVADALWMDVPVVTLTGRRYASRIATSKLRALNLGNWCAGSLIEYVNIALKLARSPMLRAEIRAGLRPHMRASSLCDGEGHARAMEEAYFDMWAKSNQRSAQSVT